MADELSEEMKKLIRDNLHKKVVIPRGVAGDVVYKWTNSNSKNRKRKKAKENVNA